MLAAGAVGVYYLRTEHLTHLTQAIPYLFLLACPLMHLFHGHGHGHGQPHPGGREREASDGLPPQGLTPTSGRPACCRLPWREAAPRCA
jgi:hypothetical protein